jgi:hypothetical protein
MANLSGSLVQVENAVMTAAAAEKYIQMTTAYGKSIPVITAYASQWDLYTEAAECYIGTDKPVIDSLQNTMKPLLAKADPTDEDRQVLENFFGSLEWGDSTGAPNWDYSKQTVIPQGSAWTHHLTWKCSWAHPYFADGTMIYGIPHRISVDPRRTGNYVLFNVEGNEPLLKWLFQNSYVYGFYWYGPLDGAFMYVGTDKLMSEEQKKALSFGYHANAYALAKQGRGGTAPESEKDITDWINQKLSTISDEKERKKYAWIHWELIMNIQ